MGLLTSKDAPALKQQALDETKADGDGNKAIALAILYLAEAVKSK